MGTYEVGEGIEFLAHEAGLVAPAGDFAVEEVEEEAEGEEGEGCPEVGVRSLVAGAVAEGGEDREDSAEAWGRGKRGLVWRLGEKGGRVEVRTVHLGDEIGEVHRLNEGEVAPFGGEEVQVFFLGVGCGAAG